MDLGAPYHEKEITERKVMIMSASFKGEYSHSVDSKGRMIVPSKFREELGVSFVIARGMDRCINAYPKDEWEKYTSWLETFPEINKNARKFTRAVFSSAFDCEIDNQGRINIPAKLREFAGITKDVTVIGFGNKVEIWSKEVYDLEHSDDDDLDELASGFGDFGSMK
ncbi:MAG: division/cell wall cluster transcriptional repressor MraZ [Lachnospiraceae bacterium]